MGIDDLRHVHLSSLPTGEFYGYNLSPANLDLIADFFDKYPDYAERTFLSVKVSDSALCPHDSAHSKKGGTEIHGTRRGQFVRERPARATDRGRSP